jgi:hypothetical protein
MCFSAEVSVGTAAALLPVGGYCLAAAWRKNRAYLPLAAAPLLFGLQQLCESRVWDAVNRGDSELARVPSLAFLFFALALWPVWIPLATAAIEPSVRKRRAFVAAAALGLLSFVAYYLPVAADGRGLHPTLACRSIRYDFSAAALARSPWWRVVPALYVAVTCGPLLASSDRRVRPLGAASVVSAAATYALFEFAFASVWCFFAAALSAYLAFVLHGLPDQRRAAVEGSPRAPSGPGIAPSVSSPSNYGQGTRLNRTAFR